MASLHPTAMKSLWRQTLRAAIHLGYPDLCGACGDALFHQEYGICSLCRNQLPYTHFHRVRGNPVERLFWGRLTVVHATALLFFERDGAVRDLLHNIKYKQALVAARQAGRWLGETLADANWEVDSVVPVPLHPNKLRSRGYNQSLLIARGVADTLGIRVLEKGIVRVEATASQTRKSRWDRWRNVATSFAPGAQLLAQPDVRHVLVIDDVITTGATLEACGQALLQSPKPPQMSMATLALAS